MTELVLMFFIVIRTWMIFVTLKVFRKQTSSIRKYHGSGDGLDQERLNYLTFSVLLLTLHFTLIIIDIIEIFYPGELLIHRVPVYAGINLLISSLLTWRLYRLYEE